MKGKTLRDISFWYVMIGVCLGTYSLFFATHITTSGLPYLIGKIIGLLGAIILFGLYAFALDKQRIRMAKIVYRIWWIPGVILFTLLFLQLIIGGKWILIVIVLCMAVPFGLSTFFLWIGLKGLKKMENNKKEK